MIQTIKKRIRNRTFIMASLGLLAGLVLSVNIFPWASVGVVAFLLLIGAIVYLLN